MEALFKNPVNLVDITYTHHPRRIEITESESLANQSPGKPFVKLLVYASVPTAVRTWPMTLILTHIHQNTAGFSVSSQAKCSALLLVL